jgi:6-phosphogluconolactonase (cycloisomerase 2 family)
MIMTCYTQRICLMVLILFSTFLLTACGGGGDSGSPIGSNTGGVQDVGFSINTASLAGVGSTFNLVTFTTDESTGTLKPVSGLDLQTNNGASIIALPHGRFLFVAQEDTVNSSTPRLKGFTVNKAAPQISPSCAEVPLSGHSIVGQPVLTPQETFLLLPSFQRVDAFKINGTTGCPTGASTLSINSGFNVTSVAVHPSGTVAYLLLDRSLLGTTSDIIGRITVDATTGQLAPQESVTLSESNSDGTFLDVHPSGKFVYSTSPGQNFSDPGLIFGFVTDNVGKLTASGTPITGKLQSFAFHPGGQFLYGVSGTTNRIVGYSINPTTGVLTPLNANALPQDVFLLSDRLSFSPNGNFAYVGSSSGLFVYQFNSDGSLTALPNLTVTTGEVPGGLLGHSWDKLYVVAQ